MPLPERVVPTFHVIGLATLLANAVMAFFWEHIGIRFPKATVLAPVLLTAAAIVTVFDSIFTAAMTTAIHHYFCDHLPSLSPITCIAIPPMFFHDDHLTRNPHLYQVRVLVAMTLSHYGVQLYSVSQQAEPLDPNKFTLCV